jgi:hypothetical protein
MAGKVQWWHALLLGLHPWDGPGDAGPKNLHDRRPQKFNLLIARPLLLPNEQIRDVILPNGIQVSSQYNGTLAPGLDDYRSSSNAASWQSLIFCS